MSTQPRGRIARFAIPPPVFLSVQLDSGTNVVLTWPTNATGYTLEANGDLNYSYWYPVWPPPVIVGTNNVVTNTHTESMLFYRLRK
jgi:hypothetical protein